jgi:hypothetical protein
MKMVGSDLSFFITYAFSAIMRGQQKNTYTGRVSCVNKY